jgi:hypothetical protein
MKKYDGMNLLFEISNKGNLFQHMIIFALSKFLLMDEKIVKRLFL